jgi:hypothetical protein
MKTKLNKTEREIVERLNLRYFGLKESMRAEAANGHFDRAAVTQHWLTELKFVIDNIDGYGKWK